MIKKDLHVHLHGCLTAKQLWNIGKDCYKERAFMLDWYASEYEKAWGRKPKYVDYWETENGFELLKQDYIFDKPNPFERFQANFNLIIALCNISPDNFFIQEQIIREVHNHNLEYFEARTLIPFRFDEQQAYSYLRGLCETVKKLNRELDMTTKLVFSLFRDNDLAEKHYKWIRAFINENPNLGEEITGIDFAYAEEGSPPKTKRKLFEKFKLDNDSFWPLKLLYHVGESFEDKGIISAIRWVAEAHELGADRLGHAIALGVKPENYKGKTVSESSEEMQDTLNWLYRNEELLSEHGYTINESLFSKEQKQLSNSLNHTIQYDDDYIAEAKQLQKAVASMFRARNVTIESCPTSNLRIGQVRSTQYHPLKYFKEANLNVVIGTDDPGIFNIDWKTEYELAKHLTDEY